MKTNAIGADSVFQWVQLVYSTVVTAHLEMTSHKGYEYRNIRVRMSSHLCHSCLSLMEQNI